jgi:hypothetical protein
MLGLENKIVGYTVGLILVANVFAQAQSTDLLITGGIASYQHADLRSYQQQIIGALGVDATITDEFPAYYTYGVGITFNRPKWTLSFELNHGSTGGRIYYADYSGSYVGTQMLTYNSASIMPSAIFFNKSNWLITGGVGIKFIIHKLMIRDGLTIGNSSVAEGEDFAGANLGFQPQLLGKKYISSVFVQASLGYEFQTPAQPESDDGLFLADKFSKPVHLKGSGYRASVGIGVKLQR